MKKREKKLRDPYLSTTGEKIRFALGDVGCNIMWGFIGSFLTYYYTDNVLIAAGTIGTVMLVARIFDGISDIIMGFIIERTHSRWGKARPWLLWAVVPLILTFLALFYVPSSLSSTGKVVYMAVTYILLSAVTYTAVNMAYITFFTLFAPDSNDRNVAATFRTLFAMLTALVIGMVTMPMLNSFGGVASQAAWTKLTVIYAIISFICIMITFLGVKEKEIPVAETVKVEQKRDRKSLIQVFKGLAKGKYFYLAALLSIAFYLMNSTGGANIYFAKDIMHDENFVGILGLVSLPAMVLGAILAPILYNKVGKRKTMVAGSIICVLACAAQLINPYSRGMFLGLYALKGFGSMLFGTAISTLPGEVADWGEWKLGVRAEGIVTSLGSFGSKVGSGLGGGLVGWILAAGMYDGSKAVQEQSALNAEITLMIVVPMILAIIQIVLLIFWDMDKKRPGMMEDLKHRRAGEAEEA